MRKAKNMFIIVFLMICSFYVGFTIVSPKKTAQFLGFKPFIVLSNSMSPTFNRGDVVIIVKKNPRELQKGDIIAFDTKRYSVVHRLVEISKVNDDYQYRTKADANDRQDYWWLKEKDIYGKMIFKVSFIGHIVLFLRSIYGIISAVTCVGLYYLYRFMFREEKECKDC